HEQRGGRLGEQTSEARERVRVSARVAFVLASGRLLRRAGLEIVRAALARVGRELAVADRLVRRGAEVLDHDVELAVEDGRARRCPPRSAGSSSGSEAYQVAASDRETLYLFKRM